MHEKDMNRLIEKALDAKKNAYAPYSGFHVGACLLGESGAYYTGCNVENSAYSPTICAERTAVVKAISEAEQRFRAIAVASDSESFTTPCGTCRQVLAEFCGSDMPVICANKRGDYVVHTLGELLPAAFTDEQIKPKQSE